ncbi:GTPase IMAP family member 4-like [Patella vulgata]|uniref:GTPase IMAP family member 4-like n=1 Tax=Patella vulgata TaxID=6465 RepID=UPI0024A94A73|nr:GTPase IMAP family member 4-like [Patella vulgata]
MPFTSPVELRMVMLGKTGAGKSATGNSLLQTKLFKSNNYGASVTVNCKFGNRHLDNGKKLVVIDTPGIFDTRKSNLETSKEVIRCIGLASPGPHVFIFVLKIGRFTQEEMETIQHLKDLFGEDVVDYVIIVFTGKDSLDYDDMTIHEHIQHCPPDLQSLVAECHGRIATINNRAEPPALARDVKAILDLMAETVRQNGGKYYTGEMFEGAERAYQEKLRLLEEEKNKKERELEQKEREIEEEAKRKMKEIEAMKLEHNEEKKELERIKKRQRQKEQELEDEREKIKNIDPRQEYREDVQAKDGAIVEIARGIEKVGRGIGRGIKDVWNGFLSFF